MHRRLLCCRLYRPAPLDLAVIAGTVLCLLTVVGAAADWREFRGEGGASIATGAQLPLSWKCDIDGGGENVAWRIDLPGQGVSSPIIIGDRVIVTASSGYKEQRLHVLCFDAADGRKIWERQFRATGRTICHETSAVAANTPASDGRRVVAFFSSNDLVCLDLDGNLLWLRGLSYDYPNAANDTGMASSPIIAGDVVIVQVENKGDSFAAGIDADTGETRWQIEREQAMNWTSPALLRGSDENDLAVVLQSPSSISAHDPFTGRQLWRFEAKSRDIPSPLAINGTVYFASSGVTALKRQPGDGDGPSSVVPAWSEARLAPGYSSVVVDGGRLYSINGAGALTCANAATGEIIWRLRLKGKFWATPVICGDKLYAVSEAGEGQVVQLGDNGTIIGGGAFDEPIFASPAVAGDALYVRSDRHLWKIAAQTE